MLPLSFDAVTAREVVGDDEARRIEAKARSDAERGQYAAPEVSGATYWAQVQAQMRAIVYTEQYARRRRRMERKGAESREGARP